MNKFTLFFILACFLTVACYAQEPGIDASGYIKDGWALIAEGKSDEASVDFQKALELEPDNVEALQGLAKTCIYLDKNKEAETALDKILELDPNNVFAMIYLAKIYSWSNRYNAAIDLYNNALKIEPANADAKIGLAEVYLWAGFSKRAVAQYEELRAEDPRNIRVYKGLAEVYLWDNRLDEARKVYQDAIEQSPEDAALHSGLAKLYYYMGDWKNSRAEYKKALDIDKSNKEAELGLKDVETELVPSNDFIFRMVREYDADDWQATTFTYGYKNSRSLSLGNSIYGAYYLSYLKETAKEKKIGNTCEFGGAYNLNTHFGLMGSASLNNYTDEPDFLATGELAGIFRYLEKNSLILRTTRELFDPLDNITNIRYAVESSIYLGRYFLLQDNFAYSDYSDDNNSIDSYHIFNWMPFKKNPDLTLGFGYRHREFSEDPPQYYSPDELDSYIGSLFSGKSVGRGYLYGIFKYITNSDGNNSQYYLAGYDFTVHKDIALGAEASYFRDEVEYHALSVTTTLKIKF